MGHTTTIQTTTTALDVAVNNNSLKVCRFIVENNQDQLITSGWTSLHAAVTVDHTEIYKIIMEKFVDKNPTGIWGMTPLHFAASRGHLAK